MYSSPEALGFESARLTLAAAAIEQGLKDNLYPAAAYAVIRHGLIAAKGAYGLIQPDTNPALKTDFETVFDMASLTKTITAALLVMAIERGELQLGQSVSFHIPEAEKSPAGECTLRQLATHSSGLPPWKPLYKSTYPTPLDEILSSPLDNAPGTHYAYSDLGYILIGEILGRVCGKPLDQLAKERIFDPLDMQNTAFCPKPSAYKNIAATRNCPWRGEDKILIGEVHDANAHKLNGVAGHAGLFSNVPDMMKFALALRYSPNTAHLKTSPLFHAAAHHLVEESQIDSSIGGHSIGWFTPPNGMLPRGDLLSNRSFGHTGFTGTSIVFDPAYDLTIIFLTNRVYVPGESPAILRLRRTLSNLVAGSILH